MNNEKDILTENNVAVSGKDWRWSFAISEAIGLPQKLLRMREKVFRSATKNENIPRLRDIILSPLHPPLRLHRNGPDRNTVLH